MLRGPDRAELDGVLRVFGDNVKALRTAAGFSQAQLEARCFLPDGAISQIEGGRVSPSFPVLLWLARALEVSVGVLTDELKAPSLSVSGAAALAVLARQPGLETDAVARALGLPDSYVRRILRYLDAYGEIARREQGGWQAGPDRKDLGHQDAIDKAEAALRRPEGPQISPMSCSGGTDPSPAAV